jgi:hypothetical protein
LPELGTISKTVSDATDTIYRIKGTDAQDRDYIDKSNVFE